MAKKPDLKITKKAEHPVEVEVEANPGEDPTKVWLIAWLHFVPVGKEKHQRQEYSSAFMPAGRPVTIKRTKADLGKYTVNVVACKLPPSALTDVFEYHADPEQVT
jgi:hypothetical protein